MQNRGGMYQPGGMGGSGLGGGLAGLGSLFGGLFSHPEKAYDQAMKQYQQMLQMGGAGFNPFIQAGQGAINPFMQSLNQMQDPTKYMEGIMGKYQQSPFAKQQTDEAMRMAQNQASASGLLGSSPLMQESQKMAADISSKDMQQYLQNAMGIQGSYLGGLQNLMGQGLQGQGGLASLYGGMAPSMGEAAYGGEAAKQQKWPNIFGGLGGILGSFFGL